MTTAPEPPRARHIKFWGGPRHFTTPLVDLDTNGQPPGMLNVLRPYEVPSFVSDPGESFDAPFTEIVSYRLDHAGRYQFTGTDQDYWGNRHDRVDAEHAVEFFGFDRYHITEGRDKRSLAMYYWLFPLARATSCTVLYDIAVWHLDVPYAMLCTRPVDGPYSLRGWV